MKKQINIVNAANPEHLTRMMYLSIKESYEKNLFTPALILTCIAIDGLGKEGTPKEEKEEYKKNLKIFYPGIENEIDLEEFYNNYRNGVAHYFRMKINYAIQRNIMMSSHYIEKIDNITRLNIDRFVCDFLNYLLNLREKLGFLDKKDRMDCLKCERENLKILANKKYIET